MDIRLTFLVDGVAHLSLGWPAVPRVGDTVDFSTVNPNTPRLYTVTRTVWRSVGGELKVDVFCKEDER